VRTFVDGDPFPTFFSQILLIQFTIDLTLRFGEHRNGESLASVRENLYQRLDVDSRFAKASFQLVIPAVFG
jgi:hypothetical protein